MMLVAMQRRICGYGVYDMHTLVLNADLSPVSLLPLSTVKWEDAIRAYYSGSTVIIAEYRDWKVHSPTLEVNVPSVVMSKQYLHYQRNIQFSKRNVYLRDRYTCQYCFRTLQYDDLTMDHVIPVRYGGETNWENITTACAKCNSHKGCNRKIVPKIKPRRPSYYEMLAIRKEYPIVVPCQSWADYLDWPVENIRIGKKILQQ